MIGKKNGRIVRIKYNHACQIFFSIISFETLPSVVVRVQNKFLQQINFWPPHPHISRSETHEQNNLIPQQQPQQFYIELQSNPPPQKIKKIVIIINVPNWYILRPDLWIPVTLLIFMPQHDLSKVLSINQFGFPGDKLFLNRLV